MNWIEEHARVVTGSAIIGIAGSIFAIVWFQPQTAFIDDVVNDTIPIAAASQQSSDDGGRPTTDDGRQPPTEQSGAEPTGEMDETEQMEGAVTEPAAGETPPSFPLTLSEGAFINLAHTGTGVAIVIELEDGTRILRFEDLDVLNGPDLRVILSPSELIDDGGAYDDGAFVDLGELKGNKGNQNYEIPADIDLDDFATVAIWCRRFNVSFNAAPIGN